MRNVADKSCRENQNTTLYSIIVFGNHAVCEIMRKNMVEADRPQMAIRRDLRAG
jgi:hypothetical protein